MTGGTAAARAPETSIDDLSCAIDRSCAETDRLRGQIAMLEAERSALLQRVEVAERERDRLLVPTARGLGYLIALRALNSTPVGTAAHAQARSATGRAFAAWQTALEEVTR